MRLVQERPCVNYILSHLLLFAGRVLAQPDSSTSTAHDAAVTTPGAVAAESTCESRTVNYITHTLPQQCLTSSPSFSTAESTISSATVTSSSTATEPTPTATEQHDEELDADGNDLTTGSFMSFEEWKAMMLEKSGQEALEPQNRKTKDGQGDGYPGEDFASLGDEGEVSLDFDSYSDKISEITSATRPSQKEESKVEKVTYDEGLAQGYRSKDAGKTCKERFSYASFDGGATVLKASPGAKNAKAILIENKDSYMLLECAMQNKFFIVELSDDILVDTVVLANFEFFSSMIRHFRVSVSDRYPVKLEKWKVLGTFEARNSRDIQPFLVENPQIWAKYIRIEILTHYGNEYYCPVSLFRVHGTRMLDSWKEADPAYLEGEDDASKTGTEGVEETAEASDAPPEEVEVAEPSQPETQIVKMEQSDWMRYWDESYFSCNYPFNSTCALDEAENPTSHPESEENDQKAAAAKPQPVETAEHSASSSSESHKVQSTSQTATESAKAASSSSSNETPVNTAGTNSTESTSTSASSPDSKSAPTSSSSVTTTITPPSASKTSSVQSAPKGKTSASTSVKPPSSKSSASKGQQPTGSPTTPRNKTSTTTSSTAASPTVQDSFFKALQKRLQSLESNTTLSLQYIESQSKFLQEALARLERRQVAKVDQFLTTLNQTVLGELRDVRTLYDELWQSTVIALETQRERSEQEMVALGSRLGVLADEVVFQKRMAIVQSLLLLGCLVLVIFSRGGFGANVAESYYNYNHPAGGGSIGGAFSSSRIASPIFPSTPKGAAAMKGDHLSPSPNGHDNNPLLSVEEASPPGAIHSTPQSNSSRLRRTPSQQSTTTPESLRHRPRPRANSRASNDGSENSTMSGSIRRRPSPGRSATDPTAAPADFFRAATPSSMSMEIGYDSEPAITPSANADDGEYYTGTSTGTNNATSRRGMDGEDNMTAGNGNAPSTSSSSYTETLARRSERQLTPSSDVDGVAEYMPPLSSRPSLTHITSVRKPLPALPEDPD
ncbi:hypothetical protein F4821DRAFT_224188 [Hypoxylon rubiginosum]|uniref:Uncharacterized protein n=1 Tax=Hypoxylon rubiginosum TaxID=110542 RepID=A0ACC0DJZ5_9PEZI|nr:hypothetical protein F4821DRAFT_224188 [Hypoxylon rubiginosum]